MPQNPLSDQDFPLEVNDTRTVHRLTVRRWLQSIAEAFDLDRGIIYTLKKLLTAPGETILDYLGKGRYHYIPPFRLLLVSTALIILLLNSFDLFPELFSSMKGDSETSFSTEETARLQSFFIDYFNVTLWLYLPFGALFCWLFNKKIQYTFAEHMIWQTYLLSIGNILTPMLAIANFIPFGIAVLLYFGVTYYFYYRAYRTFYQKSWKKTYWEFSLILFLSYFIYAIVMMGITIALIYIIKQ